MDKTDSKVCTKCNIEKPNTFEYFNKTKNGKTISMCRECKKIYRKNYRQENKEKLKEYFTNKNKERWSNIEEREKEKLRIAAWRKENKEHIKQYRQENKERDRECAKEWRKTEIGNQLSKATVKKRRDKIKQLTNTFTNKEWETCKNFFNNQCAYCGMTKKLEHEHFVTVSEGGEYTSKNILPSCRQCNTSKHTLNFFEWYVSYKYYSYERMMKIAEYFKSIENT